MTVFNPAAGMRLAGLLGFLLGALPLGLFAESVKLAWNPNPEPDIAGYRLEYGTTDFSKSLAVGKVTTATVDDLAPGTTYQFRLVAINEDGAESAPCAPITHTVPIAGTKVTLTVQRSYDLKAWAEVQVIELPKQDKEFFRIKIETP